AGEGCPGGGAAGLACGVHPRRVAGSGRAAGGAGGVAGAGAGAGPPRAGAGGAVYVLPRGGAAGGGRPGPNGRLGASGGGVRGSVGGEARGASLGAFAWRGGGRVCAVNVFDEPLPGPLEWDVRRLAASFSGAGRDNGSPAKARRKIVLAAAEGYRTAMLAFA